ncbi:exopolysaccharide biosynthesis protein [Saccharophagus degradans]|uniref:exopolysaccharide biosynthesis protein n=1 Tax=Saccharophagus degradans TaxID=86304 RepID=UPI002477DD31|nr:exopolysaccharide biosynthesis protein [Saccharophagus degradans]WGO96518.1 exopolysaccharide biosynthesis protein [Saccharophagus degradans]
MSESASIYDLLEEIDNATEGDLTLGDVTDSLKSQGFGPLIFIVAVAAILPTGAIPMVPTICAVVISIFSIQLLFGASGPWLPKFLRDRSIKRSTFTKAKQKAQGLAKKLDKLISKRHEHLFTQFSIKLTAVCMLFLSFVIPPMEIMPFLAALPAAAIALFALALIARDGIIFVAAYLLAATAVAVTLYTNI